MAYEMIDLEQQRQEAIRFLSKPWQKFFNKFREIDELSVSQWKPIHMLAHIDRRFREHYNKNFAYSCKGAPSRCTEIYLIKRICAMLSTTNMRIVKEYVDWVFDQKIIPQKKKIRTLAYFGTAVFANEFYIYRAECNKITRSTDLPEQYKRIVDEMSLPVTTNGDLAFALAAKGNNEEYRVLFDRLYCIGFYDNILKDLK